MLPLMRMSDDLMTAAKLAELMGGDWSKRMVLYWLDQCDIPTVQLPGLPHAFIRADDAAWVELKLRAARADALERLPAWNRWKPRPAAGDASSSATTAEPRASA